MREGRPVHVEGPVTAALLRNLEEFQEIWALWSAKYRPVRITADQILPSAPAADRSGVFAFSGGVDGAYALLKHHQGHAGFRTVQPACAMFIHGFDIPLTEQAAFDTACRGISEVTGALGVPLALVRTNWRDVFERSWGMDCQAALTSCLFQFQGLANVGVCGAAEDYAHVILPLGCNPVTNHLLSGGGFDIVTEGGCLTRSDRVRFLCGYPTVAARLRVCWEGPFTGENCGRCEKCIRTKLNFMALGEQPLCFDRPPTTAEILGLTARDPIQLHFLREILSTAIQSGIPSAWVSTLRLAIAKNQATLPIRTLERHVAGKLRSRFPALAWPQGHSRPRGDISPTPKASERG